MEERGGTGLLTEIQVNCSNAATGGLASPESPFRSMWDLLSGFLFTRFAFLGFHPQIWMLLLAMSVATAACSIFRDQRHVHTTHTTLLAAIVAIKPKKMISRPDIKRSLQAGAPFGSQPPTPAGRASAGDGPG